MDSREKLSALRRDIDNVDHEMLKLFTERMRLSERVAEVKAQGNIAVVDRFREQQVIETALAVSDNDLHGDVTAFMQTLMALSTIRQNRTLTMAAHMDFPPSGILKENAVVAFQGVTGAWGEHGAYELFPSAAYDNYEYFDDVFEAVGQGKADYGVLPIENSQTGAIGEVYDLLKRYSCYIVGEVWVSIAQCLLAVEGTALSDIREVFSHPEGFNQCRRFLKNRSWDLTACRNTAIAARVAAEKANAKYAAIGSRRAAAAHGLSVVAPDIMDNPNNRTRFIAIAAEPIYDENSAAISVTFSTAHKSGALCAVLQSFTLAGINLTRIESRPVSHDRYRFFADIEANILSEKTLDALRQASAQCDYFEILGCYPATVEKK